MSGILVIYAGIAGFILLLIYDLASLKQIRKRFLIAAGGYGIHTGAIIVAAFDAQKIVLPQWTSWSGWPLTIIGLWWLVYCLFLYAPIRRTYRETSGMVLATGGPYAFTRHPGFIGYIVFMTGLFLVSGSLLVLKGGIIWTFCNIIYIVIQDRWIFRILFPGYEIYSRTTPMLFPNRNSFRRFMYGRGAY